MLNGRKIILTPISRADLDSTRAWANDMEMSYEMLRALPVGEYDQEQWYERLCRDPSRMVFAVRTKEDDPVHIGNSGFYHIDYLHRRAEFWMLLGNKAYWGKGIGKDVLRCMLRFGFLSLNLNRIYLHVRKGNERAIRIYEGENFTLEGILNEHYFIEGQYVDVAVMAILRRSYVEAE